MDLRSKARVNMEYGLDPFMGKEKMQAANGTTDPVKLIDDALPTATPKVCNATASPASPSSNMHSQATAYARLAESAALRSEPTTNEVISELTAESGLTVLPVSAQDTRLLPNRTGQLQIAIHFHLFCLLYHLTCNIFYYSIVLSYFLYKSIVL